MIYVLTNTETGSIVAEAEFDSPPGQLAPQKGVQWQAAPISVLQRKRWEVVRAKRDSLEQQGFNYLGHRVDSDPISVQRIAIATQAAQIASQAGQPFSINWRCADNHTLVLDAQGMLGLSVALATHANALHVHAHGLRLLIEAAANASDLDAVDIDTGWTD